MYRCVCPYCGRLFEEEYREVFKERLKGHMIEEHYDILLEESKKYKYCRVFKKDAYIEWLAGMKAYRIIRYGR